MSREMATAKRGAGAPLEMRALPDPASRVPRVTLRGAPRAQRRDTNITNAAGYRRLAISGYHGLLEAEA